MPFVAIIFLVFVLLIMAQIPWRKFQAAWLGLILLTFGCCLLGLINLISRFGNYQLEGLALKLFPINQESSLWQLLSHLTLYEFMRFRLWCVVGFLVAEVGFIFSYTSEKLKKGDWKILGIVVGVSLLLLWNYDPEHLFVLYKSGAIKASLYSYHYWENQLKTVDALFFWAIIAILIYLLLRLIWFVYKITIPQKKVQALLVGIINIILSGFFIFLFCMGGGSVLNIHTMATTLLPVTNYPEFDITFLQVIPFVAITILLLVLLLINRYGFLGRWHVGTLELERQIKVANEAVRLALHSFKNRFLAVQMGMNIAIMKLEHLEGEAVHQSLIQIQNVQEICAEAMKQLDNLHVQAGRLQANPGLFTWRDLLEEATRSCFYRLGDIHYFVNQPDEEVKIWGDRKYLVALLENLLQNSIDGFQGVKRPNFRPAIMVDIGREYEWGYIRITDNGVGIPRKILRKVFRPFFTTKPSKNSWGMGLAFCHRVVKAHRGFINLHSKEGEGTSVEVVIRCA